MSDGSRRRFGLDLDEIDAYLAGLGAVADDAELRARFGAFQATPAVPMPDDPFSPDYRAVVLDMYGHLAGRHYDPANEVTWFDVGAATERPFPYLTQSARAVGDHLMLLGQCLRMLDGLAPGSTVLDCGAGWGNTTIALARSGFRVAALEVDDRFAELLARRAEREQVPVEVLHGDYLTVIDRLASEGRRFDAVQFFESFHHCDDPVRLVSMLDSVVEPGGCAVFASEPVIEGFHAPWGIRLDGESVWAIRSNGWLELGFQPDFFVEMLARHGWVAIREQLVPGHPSGFAYVARRSSETRLRWTPARGLLSQVGRRDVAGVSTDGRPGFLLFGPYAAFARGAWRFTVEIDASAGVPCGPVTVRVCCDGARVTFAATDVDAATVDVTAGIVVDADIDREVTDLEIQVAVEAGTQLHVVGVNAVRLGPAVGSSGRLGPASSPTAPAMRALRRVRRRLPPHPLVDRAIGAVRRMAPGTR